jgi:uncharacterized repeat protein (TIGR03803 family)
VLYNMNIQETPLPATLKNGTGSGAKYAADFPPDSAGGKQFAFVAAVQKCAKYLLCLRVLIAGLFLIPAGKTMAQTLTSLHHFTKPDVNDVVNAWTNSDGANPQASLVISGRILYGTCPYNGKWGSGSIFAINTDGTGFTNLYHFSARIYGLNVDGAEPLSSLVLSSNVLYGTTASGGFGDGQPHGTVFAINTDGTGFVKLHDFGGGDDGSNPRAGLVLAGNTLYGTTKDGGSSGDGTIFAINTDGTGFTNLYNFDWNNDGAHPVARLLLSDDTFFGTTQDGGSSGYGIIFRIKTDGACFTNLHNFTAGDDGANPEAGLVLSSNMLYGTTENYGPLIGYGTVFGIHLFDIFALKYPAWLLAFVPATE